MARPPKPESERRGERLVVKLTSAENAKVLADARAAGLTVPDYVRAKLELDEPTSSPRSPAPRKRRPRKLAPRVEPVSSEDPVGRVVELSDEPVEGAVRGVFHDGGDPPTETLEEFLKRRTKQLFGQGRTTQVAQREAEAEWRARG